MAEPLQTFYRCGSLRDLPAAAQGFDQQDAGGHAAGQHVDVGALVAECGALGGGDFQVVGYAAFVAAVGKIERVLGCGDGGVLDVWASSSRTRSAERLSSTS